MKELFYKQNVKTVVLDLNNLIVWYNESSRLLMIFNIMKYIFKWVVPLLVLRRINHFKTNIRF